MTPKKYEHHTLPLKQKQYLIKDLLFNLWSRLSVLFTGVIVGALLCNLFDVHMQIAHAFPKLTIVMIIVSISNEIIIVCYLYTKKQRLNR